ncbi:MAG TPA: hypothetical protein VMY69_05855 [Phycisphaerae bacterium]|nr:hypothetical protein [Phycisphaerae bacterium]
MAGDIDIGKIREAIDGSVDSAATKAAGLVIEKHFSDRQGDLAPLTEFTRKRKKRPVNSGLILVDQDKMIKSTTSEKRGWGEAAVTNSHKLMPLHTFGGPIKFFGKGSKYLPARDTIRRTCEAEEEAILEHAQKVLDLELQRNITVKKVIG